MDPTRLAESLEKREMLDQIESADIVLANRSDLATKSQLRFFDDWANNLFPKKKLVRHIQKGKYLLIISKS